MRAFDLSVWSNDVRIELDAWLSDRLVAAWPPGFVEPMRYPVFGGGKRVRPLLTVAACEGLGGARTRALAPAAAVELIHTYSLVHDDLPAMDNDAERRGRPTVHVQYDEPTAILVGDALLTEAFTLLVRSEHDAVTKVALVESLSVAAGHRGMVGGQVGDMEIFGPIEGLEALMTVHRLKTGALIRSAVVMGGIVAGADAQQAAALATFGEAVGLAFQLADDVLDAEEDAGEDGPPSYVKLLGVDETSRRARELAAKAEDAVAALPHPDALIALARFTVERDV